MKYEYFISYFYKKGIATGNGQACITLDKKINSSEIIDEIRDWIKAESKFDEIGFYNFILLKKEKIKDKIGE